MPGTTARAQATNDQAFSASMLPGGTRQLRHLLAHGETAGNVHQHVDVSHQPQQLRHLRLVGDIACQQAVAAGLVQAGERRLQQRRFTVEQHQARALVEEVAGDGAAECARGAGNDDGWFHGDGKSVGCLRMATV